MKSFVSCDPQGHQGQTNVWLTPRYLLDALGDFDLDPAAHPGWPTAGEHYYEYGLENEWFGRVWLNPPYGRDIGRWLQQLQKHGNGVALVFARTDTSWFQTLKWDAANFIKGRIKFLRPNGETDTNAGTPNVLLAWGRENVEAIQKIPGIMVVPRGSTDV